MILVKHLFHTFFILPFTTIKEWGDYSFARKSAFFFVLFWILYMWILFFILYLEFFQVIPESSITSLKMNLKVASWVSCGSLALYFGIKSKIHEKIPESKSEIKWQKWGFYTGIIMTGISFLVFFTWLLMDVW